MTPQQFITKWKKSELTERSACQQHFLDLCDLFGQPKPADVDSTGDEYTFEKGVEKTDGGKGFADVWKKGFFGWEYKGKHKDLKAAYQQLLKYREALQNPPLLVVCDLDRFEIHTNFTGTVKKVHEFTLDNLAEQGNLRLLRLVFTDPYKLEPQETQANVTEEVAGRFAKIANDMANRGIPPHDAAQFLMKLMFCMFAEDIDLLPKDLFTTTIEAAHNDPARFSRLLENLFTCMAVGDPFGHYDINWFNGGLFTEVHPLDLTPPEIEEVILAARADWSNIEPSIFGTLFERSLNPAKRSQIGAHYTSRNDIETLLKPVMLAPLEREWEAVKAKTDTLWDKIKAEARSSAPRSSKKDSKTRQEFNFCVQEFVQRLASITILDPACGSGNFLYVAINLLLDLEKKVLTYATERGLPLFGLVHPTQLRGIEIDPYAQELAQVVLWIGYLQWKYFNGYRTKLDPVLDRFENIVNADAILDLSDPANPKEPEWPAAEFIVGNPPFLGDKKMRGELGDGYVEKIRKVFDKRLPGQSDLCCYWFEKARHQIEIGKSKRAGLLATQGIRGGGNRTALERIKKTGDIFWAISDQPWVLDGAMVHVSMVGFHDGKETAPTKSLDGIEVDEINDNLTTGSATTLAKVLEENQNKSFLGSCKGGSFDIDEEEAVALMRSDGNPHGRPNSDVIRPVQNSKDTLTSRVRRWIIDNGDLTLEQACLYEKPHQIVVERVKPARDANRDNWLKTNWWRPQRMRPNMRNAVEKLDKFIVTTTTAKHRVFVYLESPTLPDHQLVVFANPEFWFLGVLHSKIHETWAINQGTQLREIESGFRYTPTTCFETFPFPNATPDQHAAIAAAAKELDSLRDNWLNPPEWTRQEVLEFPGSTTGPWKRYVQNPNKDGIGTVQYPRKVPCDEACAAKLKKRTLTNLYNERPTWLALAHKKLDEAVFAAYGWLSNLTDDAILAKLLELNLSRPAAE